MLVTGNPQEMKSWLCGFMEAEGSANKDTSGNIVIEISNTNFDLIEACISILEANNIFYSLYEDNRKNKKYRREICHSLRILGNESKILISLLGTTFQCRYEEFTTKLDFRSSETARDRTSFNDLTPDLWWMLGFWEGDGSLFICLDCKGRYTPSVAVNNTRSSLMIKVAKTLRSIGCAWWAGSYQPVNPKENILHQIRISGLLRTRRFLNKTKHLFVSDYYRNRANLLSQYIESRLSKPHGSIYSQLEQNIYWEMKVKN